ncbi:hypothetical protein F5Y19DRAFT_447815 [Xylariaceae sp. FL1651]|nr:hypothetical protein F5Y19DRAFT_447815 [Xylariaceae sp. FL1651]
MDMSIFERLFIFLCSIFLRFLQVSHTYQLVEPGRLSSRFMYCNLICYPFGLEILYLVYGRHCLGLNALRCPLVCW